MIESKLSNVFMRTLHPAEHGFQRCKSTVTNLLVYYNDLVSIVEAEDRIDAVYTDLRKAFDTVDPYFDFSP